MNHAAALALYARSRHQPFTVADAYQYHNRIVSQRTIRAAFERMKLAYILQPIGAGGFYRLYFPRNWTEARIRQHLKQRGSRAKVRR